VGPTWAASFEIAVRPAPAVQAVYCDEHAERWCYRRPAAKADSESDLGVALVEDVEDCISSVMATDPSFGGSPPPVARRE